MSFANIRIYRKWIVQHALLRLCGSSVFAAAMLTGCNTIPPYPETLPPLVKAAATLDVCPSIDGTFADAGTTATAEGRLPGSVSLTRLLHTRASEFDKADVVVVRGPKGNVVEIESFVGQKPLVTWQQQKVSKDAYLAEGDSVVGTTYLCQDGFVRLGRLYDIGGGGGPGLSVLSHKSDFLWLRKATDGSLIVLHTNFDYTLLNLVLPVGYTGKIWYQFLPAIPPISSPTK